MATWQVQEAKAHLSQVIERAQDEGPQTITKHGEERAVVLSVSDYRKLLASKPDFITWLLEGPKFSDPAEELEIERSKETGREPQF